MTGLDDKFTADLMQELAKMVEDRLKGIKPEMGFCILVYPFGEASIGNYVSNSEREDMITALRETAGRLENNQDKVR